MYCSRYCMREFDISLNQIVTVMRKKRLILLMLDDPATLLTTSGHDDLDSLRQYITQYTYIDCRSENWLAKLMYALPINGMLENKQRCDLPARSSSDTIMLLT